MYRFTNHIHITTMMIAYNKTAAIIFLFINDKKILYIWILLNKYLHTINLKSSFRAGAIYMDLYFIDYTAAV